jgi:hypothetical protein
MGVCAPSSCARTAVGFGREDQAASHLTFTTLPKIGAPI